MANCSENAGQTSVHLRFCRTWCFMAQADHFGGHQLALVLYDHARSPLALRMFETNTRPRLLLALPWQPEGKPFRWLLN